MSDSINRDLLGLIAFGPSRPYPKRCPWPSTPAGRLIMTGQPRRPGVELTPEAAEELARLRWQRDDLDASLELLLDDPKSYRSAK